MSEPDEHFEDDLIDRIAQWLPVEVRADYYRELRHCRSLPENDEMLRILRAMQFSVVLMVQVPERMATERERFEDTVTKAMKVLQDTRQFSAEHQRQTQERISQVSADIAKALSPASVAAEINESLRQQFLRSTIPETAGALAVAASQIKKATSDFVQGTNVLSDKYEGGAAEARRAVGALESTCSQAVTSTKRAAQELVEIFRQEYRWSMYSLTGLGLLLGVGIGIFFERWLNVSAR